MIIEGLRAGSLGKTAGTPVMIATCFVSSAAYMYWALYTGHFSEGLETRHDAYITGTLYCHCAVLITQLVVLSEPRTNCHNLGHHHRANHMQRLLFSRELEQRLFFSRNETSLQQDFS